jgi:hypothetical protein
VLQNLLNFRGILSEKIPCFHVRGRQGPRASREVISTFMI